VSELVIEGLAYFERVGDAGDLVYVNAIRAELARLRAELAARDAECARLRDALVAIGLDDPEALRSRIDCEVCDGEESQCVASCWVRLGSKALATEAGNGWISTEGAVTGICEHAIVTSSGKRHYLFLHEVPADWAGSEVYIIRKEPKP